MSTAATDRPVRGRVWVALDASPHSMSVLATAGALASEFGAELAGLFVEDENLQRLLALPFARELCVLSGAMRPLSLDEVERGWRREAALLQQQLAAAAGQRQLSWSFQVARGRMSTEIRLQASALDLVVLGRPPGAARMEAGQTLPRTHARPVLVRLDAAAPASPGVELAARLARRSGAELVLLVEADEGGFDAVCAKARAGLQMQGADGRCLRLPTGDTAALARAVRHEGAECLVLGERDRFLQPGRLEPLLDAIDCPVVLAP